MIGGSHQVWLVTRRIMSFSSLTTELQLRRPSKDNYRLDTILERKAKQGVKIYVIL